VYNVPVPSRVMTRQPVDGEWGSDTRTVGRIWFDFMFLAPWVEVKLYSTNRQNAQFCKLIFNFYRLLPLWNLVGSSLGKELYVQYCMCSAVYAVLYVQCCMCSAVCAVLYVEFCMCSIVCAVLYVQYCMCSAVCAVLYVQCCMCSTLCTVLYVVHIWVWLLR
jgi:hypothetical protein